MRVVTKADLILEVASDLRLNPLQVRTITDALIKAIRDNVNEGQHVEIRHFASFFLESRLCSVPNEFGGRSADNVLSIRVKISPIWKDEARKINNNK